MTSTEDKIRRALGLAQASPLAEQLVERAAGLVGGRRVFPALSGPATRALVTGSDGSSVPDLQESIDVVLAPAKGGRVAPLLTVVDATSDEFFIAVEASRDEVAAPTPYPGTVAGATALPLSGVTFAPSSVPAKRIGAAIRVHRAVLDDSAYARQALDQLLGDDVRREVDHQLLNGSGLGENTEGFFTNGDIPAQASGVSVAELVKAAGAIRTAGHTGALTSVVNPADWTAVVQALTADQAARLDAAGLGAVVQSSLAPAGSALVGDFSQAHFYVRKPLQLAVSADDEDQFLAGVATIAAEFRGDFSVVRPSAFVVLSTTP